MASGRKVYPPEFKQRMLELVRAGRSPEELAKVRDLGRSEKGKDGSQSQGEDREEDSSPENAGVRAEYRVITPAVRSDKKDVAEFPQTPFGPNRLLTQGSPALR